jgi:hypothetical protein
VRPWIFSLLLLSCGTAETPTCTTPNGLIVYLTAKNKAKGWSCDIISSSESIALELFPEIKDSRFNDVQNLKNAFKDTKIKFRDERAWTDDWGRKIAGVAYCSSKTVEIGLAEPYNSAFFHELAHVVQNCTSTCPGSDFWSHGCWTEDGIYGIVEKARLKLHSKIFPPEPPSATPSN